MESRADQNELIDTAAAHARRLAEVLNAQREDLLARLPGEQNGAAALARAAQASADVERALRDIRSTPSDRENQT